jgi:alkylhydroperoxidase family enzyme
VAQVKRDWRTAPLSEADRAMLAFAEKMTVNPSGMNRGDIRGVRAHFSEEQVFDIAVIAALFNFMDRIADAFGVELDPVLAQMAQSAPEGEALADVAASRRG